jgi:hypothetical protein
MLNTTARNSEVLRHCGSSRKTVSTLFRTAFAPQLISLWGFFTRLYVKDDSRKIRALLR